MTVGFSDFAPLVAASPADAQERKSISIKVVVVTMFEIGEDTGDRPGEFQTWVEQLPLPEKIRFPQGHRDLRYNRDKGVLGIVTGIGTGRAAASIMALGMDPRFDLSKAYWLVAGIAGVNPNEASSALLPGRNGWLMAISALSLTRVRYRLAGPPGSFRSARRSPMRSLPPTSEARSITSIGDSSPRPLA